jgi:hypothetical protein
MLTIDPSNDETNAATDDRDPRDLFAGHAALISRGLEALVLLSLLAGAIPFAVAQPIWWLRLSDSAVSLAPVILLAVVLLRLSSLFLATAAAPAPGPDSRDFRTASRWAILYTLLIPLQLLAFAWLWFDSDRVLSERLLQGERNHSALQRALVSTTSDGEIQALLTRTNPGPLPTLTAGSLADHKQQLAKAIDANWANLSANLRGERSSMLRNSIPGSVRVLLGALITAAILFMITREI